LTLFVENRNPESAEAASSSDIAVSSTTESLVRTESNEDVESDSEEDSEWDSNQLSSLTVCLKLMGSRGTILIACAAVVMLAWQFVMALFLGGAFFTAMEEPKAPRGWTGLSVSVCLSAAAPTAEYVVETSYEKLVEIQLVMAHGVQHEVRQEVHHSVQHEVQQEVQHATQHNVQHGMAQGTTFQVATGFM
jgi:hypothetical protein